MGGQCLPTARIAPADCAIYSSPLDYMSKGPDWGDGGIKITFAHISLLSCAGIWTLSHQIEGTEPDSDLALALHQDKLP